MKLIKIAINCILFIIISGIWSPFEILYWFTSRDISPICMLLIVWKEKIKEI